MQTFPILTYHSIDESGSVISIRAETFRAQMKFLSENNFNVVSLKTFGKHLAENKNLPPKTIILTFDDGFENFYTTAFPVLNEYNFTATVFLITDYCGKFNDWSGNLSTLAPRKLMGWKEIRELSENNIEFAAHSRTHPDLTKLSVAEAEREMAESKLTIEENLGAEVTDFAYPYGIFNATVRNLAEKNFRTACSTNLGKTKSADDLFSLKRIDAYYLRNERIFRSILSANFDLYLSFRQAMRDLKTAWYNKT
ncbi:MAG: polysaccharide deacetylase family protein [Pyrinomonadaceae bacterium]